jgi:hypothetical protein
MMAASTANDGATIAAKQTQNAAALAHAKRREGCESRPGLLANQHRGIA